MSYFLKIIEKQYAVIRGIEIIGEASKNISKELKARYRKIPWKKITGIRDILIHKYFGIKIEQVWEVTQKEIPELKRWITDILKEINNVR